MIDATTPNWKPLEMFLGDRACLAPDFMWMYRNGGFEYYKHRATRAYLILDSAGNPRSPSDDRRLAFRAVTGETLL
jgi:hypothetical protein